jgi:ribosomal protein L1
MNEDKFNIELRKFLKKVGITSQREIEKAIRAALEEGRLEGNETVTVSATLELPELGTRETIKGSITLE